ncbi:MAG: FlaG protein [Candidatus Brocadiaceae bacterium]|nr:FlaG protein [Candidatus Brocadiaceae bacterium]
MKTTDVTNAPVYGIQAAYAVKSEIAKNTADAKKTVNPHEMKEMKEAKETRETKETKETADEPKKKVASEKVEPTEAKDSAINTKVQFSIERELNLIVTRVMDASTNKVIRQIPAEETIKRLKLKYQQSQKGTSTNDVVV